MPDNSITIIGNITREPELTFLNSGQASVKLGVAVNRRWQNRQTHSWVWEEKVSFFDVVAYGSTAENTANSLHKGDRAIVSGKLEQRSWENDNGEKRSITEISADEIAPSLRFATAVVTRTPKSSPGQYGGGYQALLEEEPF